MEWARPEDPSALFTVHRAAIRGTASAYNSTAIIEAWAPLPIGADNIEALAGSIASGRRACSRAI
jgi:hypothetical protein